jgi:HPt (histidine-containing phosphotransfer) domain-containing protein
MGTNTSSRDIRGNFTALAPFLEAIMNEMNVKADPETKALIAELWQRHLPTTRDRLATLDRIAAKAALEPLAETDRQEGIAISHKFAGSLGMYGYTRGTELAMQLEKLFRSLPPPQPDLITPLTTELRESIFPTNS